MRTVIKTDGCEMQLRKKVMTVSVAVAEPMKFKLSVRLLNATPPLVSHCH